MKTVKETKVFMKNTEEKNKAARAQQFPQKRSGNQNMQLPQKQSENQNTQLPKLSAAGSAAAKPSKKEMFLLLGAFIIALLFNLFCTPIDGLTHYSVFYCAFFLVFAAVMLIINRDVLRGRAEVFFVLGAVLFLMGKLIYVDFHSFGESFFGCGPDLVFNTSESPNALDAVLSPLNILFTIPVLLMLIPAVLTYGFYENGIAYSVKAYFSAAFVNLFRFIGKPFVIMHRMFKAKSRKGSRILIGLLIGIPVFILLAALLILSDAAMKAEFAGFFERIKEKPFEILLRLIFIIVPVFMLSYSLIYSILHRDEIRIGKKKTALRLNDTSAAIILGLMLAAYIIFGIFRFAYLTGIFGLPEGLTYSEYAVNGFTELGIITFINVSAFAAIFTFCKNEQGRPNKLIRGLLTGLLIASLLLLVSAVYRLSLYIGAYGLTVKRILALWFETAIFIVLCFCTVKLIIPKFRAAYWGSAAVIIWYLLLNIINFGKFIVC